jgi:hypothetical protein
MYASDYPHSECQFPQSVHNILAWSSLKPDSKRRSYGQRLPLLQAGVIAAGATDDGRRLDPGLTVVR